MFNMKVRRYFEMFGGIGIREVRTRIPLCTKNLKDFSAPPKTEGFRASTHSAKEGGTVGGNCVSPRAVRKAQVFSADAVFSLLIFFAAMSVAIFLWMYLPVPGATMERAENVADYLLMQRLGTENALDSSIIDNFSAKPYSDMKRELGVPEDFYFNVTGMSSSVIKYGGLAPQNANYVVNIRRIAALNGSYVYLDTVLWK